MFKEKVYYIGVFLPDTGHIIFQNKFGLVSGGCKCLKTEYQ